MFSIQIWCCKGRTEMGVAEEEAGLAAQEAMVTFRVEKERVWSVESLQALVIGLSASDHQTMQKIKESSRGLKRRRGPKGMKARP